MSSDPDLTNELVLTAGTGISVTQGSGIVTIANTGDISNTNEIQNVITNKGLQRNASNNFGIINCSTNQILQYNSSSQWICTDTPSLTESDTLQTVTNRGAFTSVSIGVATDGVDPTYGLTVGNGTNNLGIKATGNSLVEHDLSVGGNLSATGTISEAGILLSNKYLAIPSGSAQGDILYYNGTSWTRLAAGISGQVLQTNGSAAPSWVNISGGSQSLQDVTDIGSITSNSMTLFDSTVNSPSLVLDTTSGFGQYAISNKAGTVSFTNDVGSDCFKFGSDGNLVIQNCTNSKITVATIDPQYDINGEKYATYVSDYSGGVRTETAGKEELGSDLTYTFDFDNLPEGSDAWLFAQTVDFGPDMEYLSLLLTPEGANANLWYELLPSENKLIVHGDKQVKFSFRMSAPRSDWREHPTSLGPVQQ